MFSLIQCPELPASLAAITDAGGNRQWGGLADNITPRMPFNLAQMQAAADTQVADCCCLQCPSASLVGKIPAAAAMFTSPQLLPWTWKMDRLQSADLHRHRHPLLLGSCGCKAWTWIAIRLMQLPQYCAGL